MNEHELLFKNTSPGLNYVHHTEISMVRFLKIGWKAGILSLKVIFLKIKYHYLL